MKNDIYTELSAKLGVPNSERFVRILEESFTPVEAKVCRELFEPATCSELSSRMELDEKTVSEILDSLVDKGALTRGATEYAFHTSLLAFHHESVADTAPHTGPNAIPEKVKALWNDFFREEWSYMFLEHTEQMVKTTGRNLPIWPAIEALERSTSIGRDDILPEENWRQRIIDAKRRIIAPCGCRVVWGICDHPLMTCFACFDRPRGEYYLNQPGRLLKEITLAESIDTALEAEQSGLVHWGDCYCCDCCCENLFPVTREKRFDLMTPNRFAAVVDEDKCKGCQECLDRCKFEAIEMRKSQHSRKYKAYVDPEKCKGCGLCVITCKYDALSLEIVRPPEYIKGRSTSVSDPKASAKVVPVWGHYDLK